MTKVYPIIKRHRLEYIPQLSIDPEIFVQRFSHGCSMCNCNGNCCSDGVMLDLKEKEMILAHAELIQRYLEPQQEKDTGKWFDNIIERDLDFPSGQCDGTAVKGGGCVFLDSKGLCSLQKVSMTEGMHKFQLKPFYCIAFPLTIEGHVLTMHEPEFTNRYQCCSTTPDGSLTVLDVCREEFEYILGDDGLEEIEKLFHEKTEYTTVSVV